MMHISLYPDNNNGRVNPDYIPPAMGTRLTNAQSQLLWTQDPTQHIRVACRLCGEAWFWPIAYEESFRKDPSWECPHCTRELKRWGR